MGSTVKKYLLAINKTHRYRHTSIQTEADKHIWWRCLFDGGTNSLPLFVSHQHVDVSAQWQSIPQCNDCEWLHFPLPPSPFFVSKKNCWTTTTTTTNGSVQTMKASAGIPACESQRSIQWRPVGKRCPSTCRAMQPLWQMAPARHIQMLHTMRKAGMFNKSSDISRFNIVKKFFESVTSKISLMCCSETNAV